MGRLLPPHPLIDPLVDGAEEALIARAKAGDQDALADLVGRHQRWIFNVAVRMVHNPADAEDVTQEVLLKVVTRLGTFRGEAAFRTWLYRIVKNHVLNRKAQTPLEASNAGFVGIRHDLDETPDLDLPDPAAVPVDLGLLVEEARISCTMAMLMCLDRRQRLVFILGECLGVSDQVGAEVTEVSADNFRQILARARRDLYGFMNDRCGLVNAANPCRCARKTQGFIERGWVNPNRLQFVSARLVQIRQVAPARTAELSQLDRRHAEIFRGDPFLSMKDEAAALRRVFDEAEVRRAADLDP